MTARKITLTMEQTYALIENVRSKACIWKLDHEFYNDRNAVADAWTEIAEEISLPEELIRIKWKNLRDLFMREVKRLNITDVNEYHGKWKYFKKLSFLYRSNLSLESNAAASEEDSSDLPESKAEPYSVKIEPADCESLNFDAEVTDPLPEKRKRKEKKPINDLDDVADNLLMERTSVVNQVYTDEDFDMMFLKSLTPYFKALKPTRKLVIRNKIQEMLIKEILQHTFNGQL